MGATTETHSVYRGQANSSFFFSILITDVFLCKRIGAMVNRLFVPFIENVHSSYMKLTTETPHPFQLNNGPPATLAFLAKKMEYITMCP